MFVGTIGYLVSLGMVAWGFATERYALVPAFIFLFIALPEEILFRGVIHRYLERVLRWSQLATLLLSSVIFGAAHLNNPPNVGTYFLLATLAGIFYGRTFLRTGKVVPAAMVHLAVDWMWSVVFAG